MPSKTVRVDAVVAELRRERRASLKIWSNANQVGLEPIVESARCRANALLDAIEAVRRVASVKRRKGKR